MNNKEKNSTPPRFGWRDKLGYLIGNLGNDFTFTFAGIFLLVFYTKVLGIASELVGTMFLIARFLDAFTDVTMGRLVDRTRGGSGGRFRPWLIRMAAPAAFASFLMYQSTLADASYGVKVTYMFVTYLVWGSIFYTAVNIPYGSMASVISADADHRASLSTARSLGSVAANLIVGVIAPAIIYTSDQNGNQIVRAEVFPRIAAIFSILAFICYLLCYFMTTERVVKVPIAAKKAPSFSETAKTLITDRALIGIVVASIGILAAQLLNQSINQYLFIDYFRDKRGIMIMTVASMLPTLVIAPLAVPVTRRFGKKEVGIFGCFCGATSCFLLYFLQTTSMWTYIIVNVLGFLGFGIFNLIMWAFITDIIDDREVRLGTREDGTVYAVYSFARKLGQAIAGGLGGWTLAWIGFDSGKQVQSEQVVRGIYNIATLLPAFLYLAVGLSLAFIYPLGKKRVLENASILRRRAEHN
ncbi:MAG: MFS transporter [Clostridia bacterium]|nr:MFS transporter [Clostridia bacterium]